MPWFSLFWQEKNGSKLWFGAVMSKEAFWGTSVAFGKISKASACFGYFFKLSAFASVGSQADRIKPDVWMKEWDIVPEDE